jgi:hypothetical protein
MWVCISITATCVHLLTSAVYYCCFLFIFLLVPQFTFLLDDVGVPLNYRHMEGFGVHTFMLLNKAGKETLVKFHWKPSCGEACSPFIVIIIAVKSQ